MALPGSMTGVEMSKEQIDAFLKEYQYVAIASLRKDGSPNIVPMGYAWDGEYMYISIARGRNLQRRVERDSRICVCVFNNVYPSKAVIMHGKAEFVDDPGDAISASICRKYQADLPGMDFDRYLPKWLGRGRLLMRIKIDDPISFDFGNMKGFAY